MVEQPAPLTRYIRAFALFVLLGGIIAMHIAVFGMGHGSREAMSGHPMPVAVAADQHAHDTAGHDAARHDAPPAAPPAATLVPAAMPGGLSAVVAPDCDCGDGHSGTHGCVFVLAALLLALGLALLGWVGLRNRETAATKVRQPRTHRARPPPWTVLTLAELAILRI
ncbi:hypothetical protein [Nocardia sp. NPDC127526]|uniref:hypothetical protein n=1 Tax=Nocardia sp. NPDC127526 TaxID=3345393 RepID=UPI00364271D4